MEKYTVIKFNRNRLISGFYFRRGYMAVVYEGRDIVAATSGWCSGGLYGGPNNAAFIYRPHAGNWEGEWVDDAASVRGPHAVAAAILADIALCRDGIYNDAMRHLDEEA